MMFEKIANKIGKYTVLLISLLIALILYPALEEYEIGHICLTLWSLITVVAIVVSLNEDKKTSRAHSVSERSTLLAHRHFAHSPSLRAQPRVPLPLDPANSVSYL